MRQLKVVLFETPDSLVEIEFWGHCAAFNATFRETHLPGYWDTTPP